MEQLLSNLVVVETANVLAGPSVGMFLAELGATVIKVENKLTKGDVTRSWKLSNEAEDEEVSAYFASVNWGKKTIALDFNTATDLSLLQQLIAKSDILIQSFKLGDDLKFGLKAENLLNQYPKLIIAEVNGYGYKDNRVAYDAIIQAESGFMYLNGLPNEGGIKMPVALVDVLAAHQLKQGILLALLEKNKTHLGKIVRVSLLQAAIAALVNQGNNYLQAKQIPQAIGSDHPNIFPYGLSLLTKDRKKLVVAISTNKQFAAFCALLNLNMAEEDLQSNLARVKHREKLRPLIQAASALFAHDYLAQKMLENHIPFGSIRNMEEVFQLPQAKALVLNEGAYYGIKTALTANSATSLLPPPKYNEHEDWVKQFIL